VQHPLRDAANRPPLDTSATMRRQSDQIASADNLGPLGTCTAGSHIQERLHYIAAGADRPRHLHWNVLELLQLSSDATQIRLRLLDRR
jgi:hypothetical protein